jgi:hypothetical protein
LSLAEIRNSQPFFLFLGSRDEKGSSKRSRSGCLAMACARAALCLSPPDAFEGFLFLKWEILKCSISSFPKSLSFAVYKIFFSIFQCGKRVYS